MIDKFLKAKHWQLFLLIFGIPMIFQFVIMGNFFANLGSVNGPEPSIIFNYMRLLPIIIILFILFFFGWFWSIVTGLQKIIPDEAKMKLIRFKIFFFIPLIYILFFSFFIGFIMNEFSDLTNAPQLNPGFIFGFIAVILPLHLFSMFCMFHSLYFVAKALKTAELKKEVGFPDFVLEFFLLWFYPVGIWIIQPRINKIMEEQTR